jgi:hypothetical protein
MCFRNFFFENLKKALNSSDPRSLSHLAEPHVLFVLVRHHFGREAGGTALGLHSTEYIVKGSGCRVPGASGHGITPAEERIRISDGESPPCLPPWTKQYMGYLFGSESVLARLCK